MTALTRKHGAPQALAERASIVLAAAAGLNNKEIAAKNNKEIAAKVGLCRHSRHMAQSLCEEPDGWYVRRSTSWCVARDRR